MSKSAWSRSFNLSISQLDENYEHSKKRIFLIVSTVLIFLLSLTVNIVNATGSKFFGLDIFPETSDQVFSLFHTDLASTLWITYMWIVIYIWQGAWLVYGVTTIFRKSSSDYFYKYPPVMHWLIYLNFSITNILHLVSLGLWSHKLFGFATFYTAFMFISLYIAVSLSLFKLSDYQREMYYTEKTKDVWIIRILVQNGLFMYAAWSFIMFLITLSITLDWELNMSRDNVHLLITSLLLAKLIVYFLVENFAMYSYCKFIFTPWIVYGLFLIDLLASPPLESQGFVDLRVGLFPTAGSFWDYQVSNLAGLLNINYFLEVCVTVVFVFLFICKCVKFVWDEFCNRKTFLNSF